MFPFVVQLQIRLPANDRAHFLKRKSFQSTRVFARAFVSPAHEVRNVCRYLSHCASKFTVIDYFKKFIFQYFQLIILFTSTSQAMARILELIIFLSVCQAVHTQSKIRWGKLLCDQVRYNDRT